MVGSSLFSPLLAILQILLVFIPKPLHSNQLSDSMKNNIVVPKATNGLLTGIHAQKGQ
jgi:hypothetical protein